MYGNDEVERNLVFVEKVAYSKGLSPEAISVMLEFAMSLRMGKKAALGKTLSLYHAHWLVPFQATELSNLTYYHSPYQTSWHITSSVVAKQEFVRILAVQVKKPNSSPVSCCAASKNSTTAIFNKYFTSVRRVRSL